MIYARSVAHPAIRLIGISESPLSVDDVVGSLDDPGSGGLVVFIGRVRNHDQDRAVDGLSYSAHPTALARLEEVCAGVADDFGVAAVAAVHRIGDLAIGDAAVIVATTSGHRGSSFEASRALIDRLKAQVPIWKHQRFSDGTEEWVGTP